MKWTILWFEYQVNQWSKRSAKSIELENAGKKAYAEKQIAMWRIFAQEAESAFTGKAIA